MTQVSGAPAAPVVGRDDVRVPHAVPADAQPSGDAARPDLRARGRGADRVRRRRRAPRGASPSRAYARVDAHHTYQYRSFGVPGLGFKRGLEEDLVVAPYASLLAASIRPRAVLANVARLEAMGMLGTYGLFEAVDMRPERRRGRGARSRSCARTWRTTKE